MGGFLPEQASGRRRDGRKSAGGGQEWEGRLRRERSWKKEMQTKKKENIQVTEVIESEK